MAIYEIRKGFRTEAAFRQLIVQRRGNDRRRAEKLAALAALPDDQRAALAESKRQQNHLAKLKGNCTTVQNRIEKAKAQGRTYEALMMPSLLLHLDEAKASLDDAVTSAIAREFSKGISP